MSTFVAGLRSLVAYVAIAIYILVAGPIGVFIGGALRSKRGMYRVGRAGVWLALKLTGIRYTVTGLDRVGRLPVVFCANHESNVDPAVLFLALHKQLHVFYKAELRNVPLMGTVFDVGGFVGVERGNRDKSMASIARAAESLRSGNSFLIFPEGTRSRTGELLPFKKGGFIMAIQGQVPIVPVAVHGGRASMRKGSPIVRPSHVEVRVGMPIPTTGLTLDDRDILIAQVRAEVRRLLDEM
jgi:1-acyl-sn-glycerol-3-phosphate acyltransferase